MPQFNREKEKEGSLRAEENFASVKQEIMARTLSADSNLSLQEKRKLMEARPQRLKE